MARRRWEKLMLSRNIYNSHLLSSGSTEVPRVLGMVSPD